MRVLGLALLVLGLLVAGGAWFVKAEVASACSTNQAQLGGLIGAPDAQVCRTYPTILDLALVAGLVVAGLGVVWAMRPSPQR